VIVTENRHQGTSSWEIPQGHGASIEIQAYANTASVLPGQKLIFYVSTFKEDTPYSIAIYRLGWYGGAGARLMTSQSGLIAHAQGYYNPYTHRLFNCASCLIDTNTGLVEARWQPTYTLTVPATWVTGVYLAKFTESHDMQTYVAFDVRGDGHSTYVAVTADTTYQAYNDWGGYSLYRAYDASDGHGRGHGAKVSFDRPNVQANGSGQALYIEENAIRWMEQQGYDLSYISSVDLQEHPTQLLTHRAYLSIGHDEYWSKEMRDGVEQARDSGVGLAFFGANASYWQIRFEPDSAGTPDHTIVCYKVESDLHNLSLDPFYGKDNSRVTAQWRDPVIGRPENAMIGIMYSDNTQNLRGFPWTVSAAANAPLLVGTGLQPGVQYGCDLIGNEWDRVFNNGATPAGLQILATSPTHDDSNHIDFGNTAYYIAPSGALVFATGSIYWMSGLDEYRYASDPTCPGQNPVVPGMQKLMINVMDALIVNHPSRQLS
jgi:hypothetical protein